MVVVAAAERGMRVGIEVLFPELHGDRMKQRAQRAPCA